MPVRANGYYADPALDSSIDNLAKAFGTPGGADVAGYANANATNQKAARLQDMYDYAKSKGYNPDIADRTGIAVGNLNGTNTVAAQHENNATTQRGQDIVAKTATDAAKIKDDGDTERQVLAGVTLGDGQTKYLGKEAATTMGLPEMFRGNITTSQGSQVTTPSGDVFSGPAKPMTTDELKAKILAQQPASDQRALAMAPAGVKAVIGADGKPVNAFEADTVGQTPAPVPPSTQVSIETKAPSKIEDAYGEGIGKQIQGTLDNAGNAPRNLAEIAQFRDALHRAGDNITTGPLGKYVLAAKQGIGGVLGQPLDGVPEAELINNIGFKLATSASKAISSRPTQFEFGQALATKPGLALSKPGMEATLSIMEQNAHDDQALATLAADPANRQNWTATVQKYYADHPIMSPFDPSKPLGKDDIAKLEAAAPAGGAAAPAASAAPATAAKPAADPAAVEAEMRRRGLLK